MLSIPKWHRGHWAFLMKTILVVDDHSFVKAFYVLAFKNDPYRLVFAYDGEEALAQADKENPDLIVMDVNLPRLDGVLATKALRARPKFRQVPILAVSARPWDEYLQSAGFTEYLKKPVSVSQLREAVLRYIPGQAAKA
ncbi:MAG: response regulator [Bdellovibrionota bacterium]